MMATNIDDVINHYSDYSNINIVEKLSLRTTEVLAVLLLVLNVMI